ncbi:hypothetical protein [Oceanospirillum sediminis]|uniref:Uncharacterized protein n=1 Tax=Oceanospirillum sediminis TaxID=2760088 RepID=A0A839IM13_9GAMM|nr:hypothetical protein [Oceanospirillum sediminis]MBB1485998.1 hypothetical protein [Oceanospirillum sediminis]
MIAKMFSGVAGGLSLAIAASCWLSLYLPAGDHERWFVAGLIIFPLALGGCLALWLENARASWSSLAINAAFATIALNYHLTAYTALS